MADQGQEGDEAYLGFHKLFHKVFPDVFVEKSAEWGLGTSRMNRFCNWLRDGPKKH